MRKTWGLVTGMVALVALPVAAVAAGAAGDGASNKEDNGQHDYESDASADAGLDLLGLGLVTSGDSSSGHTDGDGTQADASSQGPAVAGQGLTDGSSCSSTGDEGGAVKDADSNSLLEVPAGPVTVTLVSTSCQTHAVKTNNAHADSGSTLVDVDVDGVASAAVLESETRTRTTSGQANSEASTTLVEAEVADTPVSVISCNDQARANNGQDTDTSEVLLASVAGEDVPLPAPCPLGGNDAEADYTKN